MRGKLAFAIGNKSRCLLNALDRHFRFLCGTFEGVFGVEVFQ